MSLTAVGRHEGFRRELSGWCICTTELERPASSWLFSWTNPGSLVLNETSDRSGEDPAQRKGNKTIADCYHLGKVHNLPESRSDDQTNVKLNSGIRVASSSRYTSTVPEVADCECNLADWWKQTSSIVIWDREHASYVRSQETAARKGVRRHTNRRSHTYDKHTCGRR